MTKATDAEIAAALAAASIHDVRNHLAVARTSAHLASSSLSDTAFVEKHLGRTRDKLEKAMALIDRCLAVARGDRVGGGPVRVRAVVDDALDGVTLPEGVVVEVAPDLESLEVAGELVLLGRAVANLIDNAGAAVASKGPGRVAIDAIGVDGAVVLRVADEGPGLDPALAFTGVTTKPGGSGLGLRVSRAIAVAHGGTLELAAREGFATTFALTLPRAR